MLEAGGYPLDMSGKLVMSGFASTAAAGCAGIGQLAATHPSQDHLVAYLDNRHPLGKKPMQLLEDLGDDDEEISDDDDLDDEAVGEEDHKLLLERAGESCVLGAGVTGHVGLDPGSTAGGSMGEAGGSSAAGDTASGSGSAATNANGKPKRKAGRPILCDKDPNSADLTDEQRRILKRRMSNREYARRARQRRQEMIRELQGQIALIQQENEALADEIKKEERHRGTLRRQIQMITTNMTFFVKENARLKAQYDAIAQYIQTSGFWDVHGLDDAFDNDPTAAACPPSADASAVGTSLAPGQGHAGGASAGGGLHMMQHLSAAGAGLGTDDLVDIDLHDLAAAGMHTAQAMGIKHEPDAWGTAAFGGLHASHHHAMFKFDSDGGMTGPIDITVDATAAAHEAALHEAAAMHAQAGGLDGTDAMDALEELAAKQQAAAAAAANRELGLCSNKLATGV